MKTRINPYIFSLLRQNAPYLAICLIFFVLAILSPFFIFQKFADNNKRLALLRSDILSTTSDKRAISTLASQSESNIQLDIQLLNSLIPDSEDYFSIISSLDELSNKTNFKILSYSISSASLEQSDKLPLQIAGIGNIQAFINFLKTYNFGGNRLITLDKIEFKPKEGENVYNLSVTFYHKSIGTKAQKVPDLLTLQKSLKRLNELKDKVGIIYKQEEAPSNDSYPVKSNPF